MSNYKFKVGDKVRVTDAMQYDPPVGTIGEVLEEDNVPFVRFPGWIAGGDAAGLLPEYSREAVPMISSQLELV